ncbi:MAG: tyrosine-type recombinase/integrase [Firmicutes bacterium]|nr:tyrosine-type recombinase/integrase [Bacillota bacterium]
MIKHMQYLATRPNAQPGEPLFPSRKWGQPLDRRLAWAILRAAARAVGVTDTVATLRLRKTFGYHAYRSGIDLAFLEDLLNHASPATTPAYIGITRDDRDPVYWGLNL